MDNKVSKDIILFLASVAAAALLAASGAVPTFLKMLHGLDIVGSFAAGFFFVSVFTAAPAGVVFVESDWRLWGFRK